MVFLSFTPHETQVIAERIWQNECNATISGLTHWNVGENFASVGIGHFIWFPKGCEERFEETFSQLLAFLREKNAPIPAWVTPVCPWDNRQDFYRAIDTAKMRELREFLLSTKHLQAEFMAMRLETTFLALLKTLPSKEQEPVSTLFHQLKQSSQGLFALIDYLNFKGSGFSSQERYQGQGWGLLQVLQQIPANSKNLLVDFVKAAEAVLTQRVQNAPQERNEQKWLKGWLKRVEGYLKKF
jgi:hypothetical protein